MVTPTLALVHCHGDVQSFNKESETPVVVDAMPVAVRVSVRLQT
jgi:hypothetical protein